MTADLPESANESTFESGMIGKYRITYEHGPTSWGAWSEDVPGCFAIERSRAAVEHLMGEAIEFYFSEDEDKENDREDGLEDNHEARDGRPEATLTDIDDEEDDDLDVPPALAARILGAAGLE
jgi:hypothetical protein